MKSLIPVFIVIVKATATQSAQIQVPNLRDNPQHNQLGEFYE
jgi:hypothetical protein